MKQKKESEIIRSRYEYVSVFLTDAQVNGYRLTKGNYEYNKLKYNEYDFNDINFYASKGFCHYHDSIYSKYFQKLDFHHFDEVLNFINKIGGWRVISVTPAGDKFLYTFEREVFN